MRIVAGTFRGRPLVAPKGHLTRPTSDRARQAIFNILEHAAWSKGVRDLRVIDLFAGSGALGFEALSQERVGHERLRTVRHPAPIPCARQEQKENNCACVPRWVVASEEFRRASWPS